MSGDSSEQTVAITGSGGFIGSHVAQLMLREGYRVRALVHYNALASIGHLAEVIEEGKRNSESWVIEGRLQIVHGDILDERCARDLMRDCDLVFHLAALIGIPYSYQAPASYMRTNTIGTMNVLEAAREECPERIIVTSTSEVYGTAREVPIREQHLLQAQSPYAASKIGADKLAESYHLSFGLPVTTLRPFNTYGPRQSLRGVVPTILAQALSDRCDAIRLGNLETVRDWNYVEDSAGGYLALARAPLDRVAGRLYNLGTGQGTSVRQIAELAIKVVGVTKPIVSDEERKRPKPSEVERLIADASRLKKETGWKPLVDLEQGVGRAAKWMAANLHLVTPETFQI